MPWVGLYGGEQPATADSIRRARLRVIRLERAGLSRREIASRAGVAASTIVKVANDPNPRVSRPVVAKILAMR